MTEMQTYYLIGLAVAALMIVGPFVATFIAAHLHRQPRIGRTSAETEARRVEFRDEAFGGRR